jgi:hypothetical protein
MPSETHIVPLMVPFKTFTAAEQACVVMLGYLTQDR